MTPHQALPTTVPLPTSSQPSDAEPLGRATHILQAVLGHEGIPAGDAAVYEGLCGLARAVRAISAWLGGPKDWLDLAAYLDEQAALRRGLDRAYSSAIAPAHHNPLYGDYAEFPLYSALVAGSHISNSTSWSLLAGLACFAPIDATLRGAKPAKAPRDVQRGVYPLLREASSNAQSGRWLDVIFLDATGPDEVRRRLASVRGNTPPARIRGIHLLLDLFSSREGGRDAIATPEPEDDDDQDAAPNLDLSFVATTDTLHDLASADSGQVSFRVGLDGLDDPEQIRARTIASAREFNHVHLHWGFVTTEEAAWLANQLPLLCTHPATSGGAVGIGLLMALGVPLDRIQRIPMIAFETDDDGLITSGGVAISLVAGRLAGFILPMRPERSARQGNAPYLPHASSHYLALPDFVERALTASGWAPGETLSRHFPTLAQDTRKLLAELRKASGLRLTPGRLLRAVAREIYIETQDECAVSLLYPSAGIAVGAGRFYLSMTRQEALNLQERALVRVFGSATKPLILPADSAQQHIGSELVVSTDWIRAAVDAIYGRLDRDIPTGRRSVANVVAAVNAHSIWMVVLTRLLAFIRPVVDPLPRPHDIDDVQGFLIACDKRETTRNEHRLVPMCAALRDQIIEMKKTHAAAAAFFDAHAPSLASALRSLDGEKYASVAALPYIRKKGNEWVFRELRPEDIDWPEFSWPRNLSRHTGMAAGLRAQLPRELMSLLMGHAEIGQTPYGADSVVTPTDLQCAVTPFLNQLASAYGIRALRALRPRDLRAVQATPRFAPGLYFGDSRPERNRLRALTSSEKAHIRYAVTDPAVIGAPTLEEAVACLIRVLGNDGTKESRKWTTSVAKRYLASQWRPPESLERSAPFRRPLEPDAAPLQRDELLLVNRARHVRSELLMEMERFLSKQQSSESTSSEWLALISVCAVIFGGLLMPKGLETFASACWSNIRIYQSSMLVDWQRDHQTYRFVPDRLTTELIVRWLLVKGAPEGEFDVAAFRAATKTLLARLTALDDCSYAWLASLTRGRRLRLAAAAKLRLTTPGVLMAHMDSTRRSTPVPTTCLQRAVGLAPHFAPTREFAIHKPSPASPLTSSAALDTIRRLKKAVSKLQASSTTGGAARGTRGIRLKSLEADIKDVESSLAKLGRSARGTTITTLVIARLRELTRRGGRLKRILATSTIKEYMAPVFKFANTACAANLLSAEPSEVAEAYRRIILSGSDTKAGVRYRSLEDFHRLAIDLTGIDDLEWADVAGEVPGVKVRVDANLIHPHEIDAALQLLDGSTGIPAHLKHRAKLAIALMFDCGLRFGEVYRLRHKDISIGRQNLYIRSTFHGEVKTGNAQRVVPLRLLASQRTLEILDNVINLTPNAVEPNRALFSDVANPAELIPRALVSRLAHQALRVATGDPSTRLHHLRHSAATRLTDCIIFPEDRTTHAQALQELVGTTRPTRRAMWSLATLLGHGSAATTVPSYVHHMEFRVAAAMNHQLPAMSNRLLACLTDQTESSIRVYRSRGQGDKEILERHVRKHLRQSPVRDITAGLTPHTLPADGLDTSWIRELDDESLEHLEQLMRAYVRGNLNESALGLVGSRSLREIEQLATAASQISREMRLPIDNRGVPLSFLANRRLLPNGNGAAVRIGRIALCTSSEVAAREALRAFDQGRSAWLCRSPHSLYGVLRWLNLAEVSSHEIILRFPETEWEKFANDEGHPLLEEIEKRPTRGRPDRTRGSDPCILSLVSTSAHAVFHATLIQVARSRIGFSG